MSDLLTELKATVERQRADIDRLRSRVTELTKQLALRCGAECCDKVELLAENRTLRDALNAYSDSALWNCAGNCGACEAAEHGRVVTTEHVRDWWQGDEPGYAMARRALAKAGRGG